MTSSQAPAPRKLIYQGPAGRVWESGLELYKLSAQGVTLQGVMAGGPSNQPTPEELREVGGAAKRAFGPLQPWMVALLFALLFAALQVAGLPTWVGVALLLLAVAVLLGWPVYRQYAAYEAMFRRREELTILLSETPTQMVSSMVEVSPSTPAHTGSAARQPIAVVVRGMPAADRVKLASAITRQVALRQGLSAARRG